MCCIKQRMRALFGFPDSEAHQAGEGTRVPLLNLKVVNDNLAPPLSCLAYMCGGTPPIASRFPRGGCLDALNPRGTRGARVAGWGKDLRIISNRLVYAP